MFIDPRGPRFSAALTSVVLAAVLLTGSGWLLAGQALVFLLGALNLSPYGVIFRSLVRPRLAPPHDLEDSRPVRFAQGVGLGFALAGLIALAVGSQLGTGIFVGAALVAALLNALFGFCLGCEVYLLARRILPLRSSPASKEIHV